MSSDTMSNDYYSDGLLPEPKSIFGKIIKWVILALVILVYGLIMFRIFIKSDPSDAKTFVWTDDTVAAYQELGSEFKAYEYELETYSYVSGVDKYGNNEYTTVTYNDITSDGSFKVSNMVYVDSTDELQITVRYNRSAVETLMETYGLTEEPVGELFFFALEGVGDNGYVTEYSYTTASRFTYEYRRLVFKNVDLTNADIVYLNVYYIEDVTLSSPLTYYAGKEYSMTASLAIYDSYLKLEELYDMDDALPAEKTEIADPPYVLIEN